jgi:aspartate 1-decarboxylase
VRKISTELTHASLRALELAPNPTIDLPISATYFPRAENRTKTGRSMQVTLMKGKIHRARVTDADLHYEGSISIDRNLIEAAGFLVNERVDIYNIDTGARFSTYVIEAAAGSGTIGLNGAAARLAMVGDKVIIVAYANFENEEARKFQPRVVVVNEKNQV